MALRIRLTIIFGVYSNTIWDPSMAFLTDYKLFAIIH
jgi:hypothetical protein